MNEILRSLHSLNGDILSGIMDQEYKISVNKSIQFLSWPDGLVVKALDLHLYHHGGELCMKT